MNMSEQQQKPEKERKQRTARDRWKPPWNTYITYIALTVMSPFRKIFEPQRRIVEPYVKKGQVVADLGCGPGYYTSALAESVGPEGKVYAVDMDKNSIRRVQKKADKAGYHNIEAHASTAADLGFIKDKSIDFILAYGLL